MARAFHKRSPTRNRPAFTLIEMLVVIGLIVLMLALATAAFNVLTGNRSQEAAVNNISAMLGRARAEAVSLKAPVGVLFFRDAASDRVTTALVTYEQYKNRTQSAGFPGYNSWAPGVPYKIGQDVICRVEELDTDSSTPGNQTKWIVKHFVCSNLHTSDAITPTAANSNRPPNPAYWQDLASGELYIDFLANRDFQVLQPGIGVQLMTDSNLVLQVDGYQDRYYNFGVVMFAADGEVAHAQYAVRAGSTLGDQLQLTGNATLPAGVAATPPAAPCYSQIGISIYDLPAFRDYPGNTAADLHFQLPGQPVPTGANERTEEAWIDANGLALTVSRHGGTLIRGE